MPFEVYFIAFNLVFWQAYCVVLSFDSMAWYDFLYGILNTLLGASFQVDHWGEGAKRAHRNIMNGGI